MTFNLIDGVRPAILARARKRREQTAAAVVSFSEAERRTALSEIDRAYRVEIENELDEARGRCLFFEPSCASTIVESLNRNDGIEYELGAWTVMPNHVHVLFRLLDRSTLAQVIQACKSVSSHRINQLTGSRGSIWQADYFDTTMRDTRHLARSVRYVVGNPGKAGLKDWQWVFIDGERYGKWLGS